MVKLNGTLITGIMLGAAFVTTGGAVASYGLASSREARYADVIDATPVKRTVRVPREVCVEKSAAKRAAPARRCRTVDADVSRVVAWDVRYRVGTEVESVRLPRHPGARVLVEDGRVRLVEPTPDAASDDAPASG